MEPFTTWSILFICAGPSGRGLRHLYYSSTAIAIIPSHPRQRPRPTRDPLSSYRVALSSTSCCTPGRIFVPAARPRRTNPRMWYAVRRLPISFLHDSDILSRLKDSTYRLPMREYSACIVCTGSDNSRRGLEQSTSGRQNYCNMTIAKVPVPWSPRNPAFRNSCSLGIVLIHVEPEALGEMSRICKKGGCKGRTVLRFSQEQCRCDGKVQRLYYPSRSPFFICPGDGVPFVWFMRIQRYSQVAFHNLLESTPTGTMGSVRLDVLTSAIVPPTLS